MPFSSADIMFLLHLLAAEDKRRGGPGFGYSSDQQIGTLQAGLSIMLEIATRREAEAAAPMPVLERDGPHGLLNERHHERRKPKP